jgi:hypothetical protein
VVIVLNKTKMVKISERSFMKVICILIRPEVAIEMRIYNLKFIVMKLTFTNN